MTLGAPCLLTFIQNSTGKRVAPAGSAKVHVWLPRRSVYVMSGLSRFDWQHAISRIGKAAPAGGADAPAPAWNALNWRRSWTFVR